MGALIDASVLAAAERGQLDLEKRLAGFDDELALSVVTASELLHGAHRAPDEAGRARREAYGEALLAGFPVIAFDLVAARLHARLSARLAGTGECVGVHDLILAASALARGLNVVTRDERSFPRIPGLSVVVW
ncbi:MAG: PIN domain-containing protein [Thermoanaerobaculia bacterium]|nr:PIN domain-containing protein [Thermoanaerobaculia bacterium]